MNVKLTSKNKRLFYHPHSPNIYVFKWSNGNYYTWAMYENHVSEKCGDLMYDINDKVESAIETYIIL